MFTTSDTLKEYGHRILSCCNSVSFNVDQNGEPHLDKVFFCHEKFCPTCAKRKSLKSYASGMRLYDLLGDTFSFIHLVLTVRNCSYEQLRLTIHKMNECSSKLFRMPQCRKAFKGILRCLEVSVNTDTNTYHPHFHCLIAVRPSYFTSRDYISVGDIRIMWSDLIGQTDSMVHMRKVTEPEKAIAEVCKYCTKPFDIANTEMAVYHYERLYFATKHLRYIQSYGCIRETLHNLKIDFEELKETFEGEEVDLSGFDNLSEILKVCRKFMYVFDTDRKRYRFTGVLN